jgi:hypothetical protein
VSTNLNVGNYLIVGDKTTSTVHANGINFFHDKSDDTKNSLIFQDNNDLSITNNKNTGKILLKASETQNTPTTIVTIRAINGSTPG